MIDVFDYPAVAERTKELGCKYPNGIALLPPNFTSASSIADLRQLSEAATVKTLLRNEKLPFDDILSKEKRPPYIQNNGVELVLPLVFIPFFVISNNQALVSLVTGIIIEYAKASFCHLLGDEKVKFSLVVEKTPNGSCKEIKYSGSVEGLKAIEKMVSKIHGSDDE